MLPVTCCTGSDNTAVGDNADNSGGALTTGGNNVAIGSGALLVATTAADNTAVGTLALTANSSGTDNTAVGYAAGDAVTTGSDNTFVSEIMLVEQRPLRVTILRLVQVL